MTEQEKLFDRAKTLFGEYSAVTNSVQNSGCIKIQDDVEDIFRFVEDIKRSKESELSSWISESKAWTESLKDAYIKGKLK